MARAIKYRLQFKSLKNEGCLVNVYVDGATSSADTSKTGADVPFTVESGVTALTGAASPLVFNETDSDDLLEVVRQKTGYMSVIEHTPGELGYIVALLIQRLLLVTDGELKAQRHKGGGQQGEGEEDHPRRKGEVALKQGVHPFTSSNL
jgi:hypothetical protein